MKPETHPATIFSILATLAYCWGIWWFSGFFGTLVPHDPGAYETTMLSVVLLAPIPDTYWFLAIHWQVLACVSLVYALKVVYTKARNKQSDCAYYIPILGHTLYLLGVSYLHVVGLFASIVQVAHGLE